MISGKSISLDNADRLWGMAAVVAAQFFFTTQDMMIKWLSGEYALHQIVLIRAVVGTLLILLVFLPLEGGISALRTQRLGMHLMRGFGIFIANLAYFTSLISIPLGEATAIFFIAPVLITALSVVMLGEKVGLYRWFAVLIGLIGVMIMIRPKGDVFNAAALLPLIAALAYALVHMMTRKMGKTEKASAMAFYIQLNFVVVSSVIGLVCGDGKWADPFSPTLEFLFRARDTVSAKQGQLPHSNMLPCLWPFSGALVFLVNGLIRFHGLESFSLQEQGSSSFIRNPNEEAKLLPTGRCLGIDEAFRMFSTIEVKQGG